MASPKAWRQRGVAIFEETPGAAPAARGRARARRNAARHGARAAGHHRHQLLFRPDGRDAALQHTLVPFRSAIIATDPLTHNLAGSLMPTGRTYTETRRMMRWFRMVDDRVIFGGRGAFGKTGFASRLRRAAQGDGRHLPGACAMCRSRIAGPGLVAHDAGFACRMSAGSTTRRCSAVGYNGAGVAMSSLMGRYLAAFVRGEKPDVGLLDCRAAEAHSILSAARTGRPAGRRLVPVSRRDRAIAPLSPVITGGESKMAVATNTGLRTRVVRRSARAFRVSQHRGQRRRADHLRVAGRRLSEGADHCDPRSGRPRSSASPSTRTAFPTPGR